MFDYWMYGVIREVLKKEQEFVNKKYVQGAYGRLKTNRWTDIGKIALSLDRINKMQGQHDEMIKKAMGCETKE